MSRAGRHIELGGAAYVVSGELPREGAPRHLLINRRSKLGVLIGRFHPAGATVTLERPDAFVIGGDEDTLEVYPNEIVDYGPSDASWRRPMARAEELMAREDAAGAVECLQEVLEQEPDHCVALHALALAYLRLGDIANVYAMERRAVEVEPHHEIYRRGYVHICSHPTICHEFQQVLQDYINLFPHSTACDAIAMQTFKRMGAIKQAQMLLDLRSSQEGGASTPVSAEASQVEALVARARVAAEANQLEEACQLLEVALEMSPEDAQTAGNLGLCLARLRRYDEAVPHLHRAASSLGEPGATACSMNLVFTLIRRGNLDAVALIGPSLAHLLRNVDEDAIAMDLPGVATWLDGRAVHEELPGSAVDILDRAILWLHAQGTEVSPAVIRVRRIYERAAELMSRDTIRAAVLVITGGGEEERTHALGPSTTIGRHPNCDVQLLVRSVDKQQLEIRQLEDGGHAVTETGRAGVATLNGETLAGPRRLSSGDILRCGGFELRYLDPV